MSDEFFPDSTPQDEPEALVIGSELEHEQDEAAAEKPKREPYTPPAVYMPHRENKPRNRLACGCVGLIIALPLTCCSFVLACFGVMVAVGAVAENNRVTRSDTQILEVANTERVDLEISNNVGTVSIHGDDVEMIEVEMDMTAKALSTERAEEILDGIEVEIRRDGNRYIVRVNNPQNLGVVEHSSVDLRVTVPETLNLTATSNVGSLSVRDVTIRDRLVLTNDVGSTEFRGTLGSEGDFNITSNVGEITVEVDDDDAFRLDATSDVGKINAGIELRNATHEFEGVGGHLTGIYGDDENPRANLTITSNVGAINLQD